MSLDSLPPSAAAWVAGLGEPSRAKWDVLLRRYASQDHVSVMHAFTVERLFNERQIGTATRDATMVCRLSNHLGARPFHSATVADLDAVLNAATYPRYRKLSVEQAARGVQNNERLRQSAAEIYRFFMRFVYMEQGDDEATAGRKAQALYAGWNRVPLPQAKRQNPHRLVAQEVSALFQKVPAMHKSRRKSRQMTLWLQILSAHGPRAAGCLRSRMRDVNRIDGQVAISVPPGYRQKHTVPLFLDKAATAMLDAYLELHPGRDDPDAPLFLSMQAPEGTVEAQTSYDLMNCLRSLGQRCGMGRSLGVRSFRKHMATRAAVGGATQQALQRLLGHSNRSNATGVYIDLARAEVVEVFRRLRNGHVGIYCPHCGFKYRPGDMACAQCGRRTGDGLPAATRADEHQARRDAAGRLGLECIADLEVPANG